MTIILLHVDRLELAQRQALGAIMTSHHAHLIIVDRSGEMRVSIDATHVEPFLEQVACQVITSEEEFARIA